jgi:serine/threonine protein phosphatase PrpC
MPMPDMTDGARVCLSWARLSETGARSANQDAIGDRQQDDLACFVMSDGAGGHEGGEVASNIVVGAILDKFLCDSSFGTRALLSYVGQAIAGVVQEREASPQRRDMSATVAALLIDQSNGRAVWAHLGDTRIYLFRDARLHAVTKDHSLAQQLIDAGYARADQLRAHPQRNILFAAIGADGGTPVEASFEIVALRDGDTFLVCTDGLWEWVLEADMERLLAGAPTAEQWLAAMCRLADANIAAAGKSRDNYSAYAIRVAVAAR